MSEPIAYIQDQAVSATLQALVMSGVIRIDEQNRAIRIRNDAGLEIFERYLDEQLGRRSRYGA